MFQHLSDERLKEKLFMLAVKNQGEMPSHVPEKYKTLELCFEAVKQDENAFAYVPKGYKKNIKKRLLTRPMTDQGTII